ncbi:hypothetical protein BF93_16510 [Brachybacterium phenoliresistens]|uniref:NodB homology domain-containing protein n=1 Tax=Brachybacterium phenoliresistens TaxID=396014 RepID=Z9JU38_9MICO|nr:hypothetical protein [Brachybacterium phenoliresistens]EWS81508.1 hypothetical protein BF93_16510 [Brachybacterium phenoliresistens]
MTGALRAPDAAEAWIQHEIRRTAFVHAMGGAVDTGGLGAVALRFDHGMVNFAEHVLPLTIARRITVAQAHNPRTGDLRENRGVTAEEIDGWVRARHVEIWNHTASHRGVSTTEDILDEVVASLAEIEEQLPSTRGRVWGFNPPGIPGEDYAGFAKGSRPEEWTTEAGRIILAHHAVVSGHIPGTAQRVLDGTVRDGLAHVTMDARPVEEIIARIDAAARKRRGLQLMLHPSRLGRDGKLSVEGLTAVLDHLVALRDRGEIMTLSPYQLVLADARHPRPADPV